MNDEQAFHLLTDAAQNFRQGAEWLVARYQHKAVQTAYLITHDIGLAEDAAQETFVRLLLHNRLRGYDPHKAFEPYLMRSVVNSALNLMEKTAHWQPLPDSESAQARLETLLRPEQQIEIAELKRQIFTALGQLAPRQRAAIVQRYYLEMSEQEMAQALDAPPGTVKWLLNAARNRLREILGKPLSERNGR